MLVSAQRSSIKRANLRRKGVKLIDVLQKSTFLGKLWPLIGNVLDANTMDSHKFWKKI
jgi:hypothetical protein